ncbi:long-chain-fatty-acid--CoA ligase [Brachybacterium saurashtrense]|uniref:Long-chain fatty acid--CoA ligase n=1 Tax=Brachybacterium saurashtrense TaxID=556288 RepID=A0A345YKC1_9MICO|nr:long-chain fatty acid--CoA ligase [Brachybacterium saurashtrense]AXK44373.1 long-chain fatty acid--CoA ligase [Brachybacterium saurashtrense]RRR22984.1 long-chain fatty acid--CoA ligase [Brachybacterium saurashtrense]
MYNLSVVLEDSARQAPETAALVLGETTLTYAQVDAAANRVAQLLVSLGVEPGDRVALSCPNLPQFPIAYYGILKAGAVVVPLNVLNKPREVTYFLDDTDARVALCFEGSEELPIGRFVVEGAREAAHPPQVVLMTADPSAESPYDGVPTLAGATAELPAAFETVQRRETDTAVVLYTSGTTGRPKGAELSHSNQLMNALTCHRLFGARPGEDVHLVALPLFHTFGATVNMNAGFAMQSTLVLLPRFEPQQALDLLLRHRVTLFAGVPTMWWALLRLLTGGAAADGLADHLRLGVSGGSALPVEILRGVKEHLGISIMEGYGLSETSPVASFSLADRPRPGSIGLPVWGVEMDLIDPADPDWGRVREPDGVGEIVVRGHNIMTGYLGRPEDTAAVLRDGWFRTGDLGRRDEEGFYYVVDRAKDMILRGGYNVYPREVEEVLMTHEQVSLAAVVGVAQEGLGEEVVAHVILAEGATLTAEQLRDWAKEQMADYKYPREIHLAEQLPMTSTGKILKRELR